MISRRFLFLTQFPVSIISKSQKGKQNFSFYLFFSKGEEMMQIQKVIYFNTYYYHCQKRLFFRFSYSNFLFLQFKCLTIFSSFGQGKVSERKARCHSPGQNDSEREREGLRGVERFLSVPFKEIILKSSLLIFFWALLLIYKDFI